jgi:hypothetical protein
MSGAHADEWASRGVPNSIMLAKPSPAQLVTAVSQLLNSVPPITTWGRRAASLCCISCDAPSGEQLRAHRCEPHVSAALMHHEPAAIDCQL